MKEGFDMRGILLLGFGALGCGALISSCSPSPPVARTPMAQAQLAKELAGLVPGKPETCLPHYRSQDMVTIDDHTLLFRDGRNRVYRNNLIGSCHIGPGDALVTRSFGANMCRGDIAQVADVRNNMTVGSCVLGDFIPYTRP
jgi:hypothetical protein